jgi:uncharacterized protein (DUF1697 family)
MIGIAFVRGINVGGKNVLPMQALRSVCEGAGLHGVQTYIQSGNVVFDGPAKVVRAAAGAIADGVERARGFRPVVVVRTLDEVQAVLATRAFADQACTEGDRLLVMFLGDAPGAGAAKALDGLNAGEGAERVTLIGREVFMYFPNGVGKSKLPMAAVERAAGAGTSRNWNTIRKMVEMGEGM